eukprot:CAMPEP_0174835214 /NCGR_PEP_ID=MMETSP1114-20130205/5294_1 /TAXON_ID=312471 /ORGANISM="Neobodo designis, Strain CCAP 1951/1" /LENGTH=98 /DNA_ID=CAMNT_0016069159 /DNA_START=101 /DNA_END=395 /DNA_ORIENTATION=+
MIQGSPTTLSAKHLAVGAGDFVERAHDLLRRQVRDERVLQQLVHRKTFRRARSHRSAHEALERLAAPAYAANSAAFVAAAHSSAVPVCLITSASAQKR